MGKSTNVEEPISETQVYKLMILEEASDLSSGQPTGRRASVIGSSTDALAPPVHHNLFRNDPEVPSEPAPRTGSVRP